MRPVIRNTAQNFLSVQDSIARVVQVAYVSVPIAGVARTSPGERGNCKYRQQLGHTLAGESDEGRKEVP